MQGVNFRYYFAMALLQSWPCLGFFPCSIIIITFTGVQHVLRDSSNADDFKSPSIVEKAYPLPIDLKTPSS